MTSMQLSDGTFRQFLADSHPSAASRGKVKLHFMSNHISGILIATEERTEEIT